MSRHTKKIQVYNYSPRSLYSLSQSSRDCHFLAAPILYEYLRVKFRDDISLRKDISELKEDGLGRQFLKYTRKLDVICLEEPWLETKTSRRLWQKKDWAMEFVDYIPPASRNTFLEHCLTECQDSNLWFLHRTVSYYQQKDWEPLVSLIARLRILMS